MTRRVRCAPFTGCCRSLSEAVTEAAIALALIWLAWAAFNLGLVLMTERRARLAGVGAYVVGIWRPRIVVMPEVSIC